MQNRTMKAMILVFQMFILIVFCGSCSDRESRKQEVQAKPQRVEQAAEKPQAEAGEAGENAAFTENIKKNLEAVSQDMEALKKQVNAYVADKTDEFEKDMIALAEKEQNTYTQLKQLPDKTGAMLEDTKTNLTAMVEDIQLSYRTIYEKYIEKILRSYSARIEALKEHSGEMTGDAAQTFKIKMQEIAKTEQQAYTKLQQLPDKTGQAWIYLKKEIDAAVDELARLYNEALIEKT